MLRNLLGYALLAMLGILALKLVFGLLGFALSLLMSLLWFAALGFVLYLVLKVISPRTACRIREAIRGRPDPA